MFASSRLCSSYKNQRYRLCYCWWTHGLNLVILFYQLNLLIIFTWKIVNRLLIVHAVSSNQTFTVHGFGNGNKLGLTLPLTGNRDHFRFEYYPDTGILQLRAAALPQYFKIGKGYDSKLFRIVNLRGLKMLLLMMVLFLTMKSQLFVWCHVPMDHLQKVNLIWILLLHHQLKQAHTVLLQLNLVLLVNLVLQLIAWLHPPYHQNLNLASCF